MDELISHVQEEMPWCILENDTMLVDESPDSATAKLERCWEALEYDGFKTCTKTEYINCNFSGDVHREEMPVRIEAQVIPQREDISNKLGRFFLSCFKRG